MDVHQAGALLRDDSLLTGMSSAMRKALLSRAKVRRVATGARICRQGELADRVVITLTTPLRLSVVPGEGAAQALGQLAIRRTLNLGAVLAAASWEYTAEAEGSGFVLEIDAEIFRAQLRQAPEYSAYLERITSRRSVRELARVLRSGAVPMELIQRLVGALEERSCVAGDVILVPDPARACWALVDSARCELSIQRGGARVELATLEAGDFYGGSTLLMRMRAMELRALEAGAVFTLTAQVLRAFAKESSELRSLLGREKPELIRKVRRALIEVGAEFTKVLALPINLPALEAATGTLVLEQPADLPRPIGEPWAPGVAEARLFDRQRASVEDDSGAVALAALFAVHGRTITPSEVRRRLRRLPPSLLDLAVIAEREGYSTHAARLTDLGSLGSLELPLLAVFDRRYVVVHAVRAGRVCFFDPLFGLRRIKRSALGPHFSGAVLLLSDARSFLRGAVTATPAEAKRIAPPQSRRARAWAARLHFMKLLADSKGTLAAAAFISLALLLLSLILPKLSGLIIDDVLVRSDNELLLVIVTGMVMVNGSSLVLSGAKELCVAHLSALLDYRLSTLIYRHTLGVDAAAHDAHERDRVGATLTRMAELQRVRASISSDFVDVFVQLAQGLVFSLMIFSYSAKLGVLVFASGTIAYAALRIGGTRFRTLFEQLFDQSTRSQSETTEQIESIATIKAVSGMQQARNRWEATLVEGIELQRALLYTSETVGSVLQLVYDVARYAGLYLAVRMVIAKELSPGSVFAIVLYLNGALRPLFILARKLDELEQLGISFEKLDELLRRPLEDEERGAMQSEPEFEGDISVRGVSFRYPGDGPYILKDLSFEARRGQTIAIVGRSGSGKTTLARLLQGSMRPTQGDILFDETAASSMPIGVIRRGVGIVMQESHLFAGTIRDNIAYGDDRPDENRVREASRLAAAHEFIARFPAGYQTYLAEGGLGLSGGQRQRVSLARALYRDPKILILDEATSALDAESERAIMQNMREILRGRTAIIIAHRLHTIKNADLILVIDQGQVVETGTHATLIAGRGLYHALFAQQFNQA